MTHSTRAKEKKNTTAAYIGIIKRIILQLYNYVRMYYVKIFNEENKYNAFNVLAYIFLIVK